MMHVRSVAVKITVVMLAATAVSLGVYTCAMQRVYRNSAVATLDNRLTTLADVIGQNSAAALDFNDKKAADEILSALHMEPSIVSACLYETDGVLFSSYEATSTALRCSARPPGRDRRDSVYRSVTRPVRSSTDLVGSLCLTASTEGVMHRERQLMLIAIGLAILALAIGAGSGTLLQIRISMPIKALSEAMYQVTAGGTYNVRVPVSEKDEIARLGHGFNRMVSELERRDVIARRAERMLQEQARTDALTGLPNRRCFTEQIAQALAQARRNLGNVALLYIDLDGFKLVNDSLGHGIGDLLLCEVAFRLRSRVRISDTLARVGGDEFTVILTALNSPEDAMTAACSLIDSLKRSFNIEGHEITLGASAGISALTTGNVDGAELLRQADSAMYLAKRGGRNRAAHFSNELGSMARERLTLENQLRGAIARNEIYIDYQPEFDLRTGRLIRFEALARWRHPTLGQVPPDRFIPIAEESGLIFALGAFVMEQACREALRWQKIAPHPVQVAVNVSAVQFNTERVVDEIAETIRRTGLDPKLLQIELTESVMVGSLKESAEKMRRLRALGINLAIDDFGTGYSCLSYLPDLPVDAIKVDRAFVRNLRSGSESAAMVRSMIELAHSIHMRTIVEGVEEEGQLEMIKSLGADEVQGYLMGKPDGKPETALIKFLSVGPGMVAPLSAEQDAKKAS